MSSRRSTTIISINVNGVQIEGVEGVRSAVFQHFQSHFKVAMESRPVLGDLSFKTISVEDVADLILPFLLEEIKAVVYDCDSYKSPGEDETNIGFIKEFLC